MINTQKQFKKSSKSDKLTVPVQFKAQFYRHNVETKCGLRKKNQTKQNKRSHSQPRLRLCFLSLCVQAKMIFVCFACLRELTRRRKHNHPRPLSPLLINPVQRAQTKTHFFHFDSQSILFVFLFPEKEM